MKCDRSIHALQGLKSKHHRNSKNATAEVDVHIIKKGYSVSTDPNIDRCHGIICTFPAPPEKTERR
jgi:hypothetical protein